jgi:transcriptional regulator with XRE-family HTH domain
MAFEETDIFLKAFGERIAVLRKSKNLSYRKLAQRCNVDYSDISKIEKGHIKIQLPTILELAKGLEVHPKDLFDFDFAKD